MCVCVCMCFKCIILLKYKINNVLIYSLCIILTMYHLNIKLYNK